MGGKSFIVQGEMFFPGDDKMGFVLYRKTMKILGAGLDSLSMSAEDVCMVVADIQADFDKGGHTLVIED
ncbi:hypothetical protein K5D32_23450 [Pseudomonas cichorii]|nr:hypothetical protein [Pseudomonas cichorii]